jgi:hypothetical protein
MTMDKATARWMSTFKTRDKMNVKDECYNMLAECCIRMDEYHNTWEEHLL